MPPFHLSGMTAYPLKSGGPIQLDSASVSGKGLLYDRHWALIDTSNKVITGRTYPQLLDIQPKITEEYLEISVKGKNSIRIQLQFQGTPIHGLGFFSRHVDGVLLKTEIDQWFSDYLGFPCRMVFSNEQIRRHMLTKHGGSEGDQLTFPDQAPLLLISEASLDDLNQRLEKPVSMQNFRPNFVVSGCSAYAEDSWKSVQIGALQFDVVQACKRCVFITIDPITKTKGKEPLKTLATYKKDADGDVVFGVHLIPRTFGTVQINDPIKILK